MPVIPSLLALLLLQTLPAVGANPSPQLLIDAAKQGDVARASELLKTGAPVDGVDWKGFTPLHWASAADHLELARILLDAGAPIDRISNDGSTPLMLAAANGFTDICRLLVERGAMLGIQREGSTAQLLASSRGYLELATLLGGLQDRESRLLQAARDGNDGELRRLITLGAPVNARDARGITPLMFAARSGNLGVLQFLLARNADPGIRDIDGQSLFEWAELSTSTGKFVTAFLSERGLSPRPSARPAQALAAPRSGPPAIAASLRALDAALDRIPPASAGLRAARQRTAGVLSQLVALSARWPAESPADYRANMAESVRVLEAAIAAGDPADITSTVAAIGDDLEVKLEHCQRSGGRLGGSVSVLVRTVGLGREITSWQVFYLPKIFERATQASPDLFPQLSSPTKELLVPGRYIMWARDPATSRVSERTLVKVGEGRKELIVDLPVPADATR
jgi:ankyrin repeat protein